METKVLVLLLGLCGSSLAASKCGKILANGVSQKEAHEIVDKHNELRKLIARGEIPGQPRGINLKKLKYDASLADDAQKIANSCVFAHQIVQDGRWNAVGQNLYTSMSTAISHGSDWSTAIQSWFDEHKDYRYKACCDSGGKMTGHYTQVVWANTEYVGCGYIFFETNDFFRYNKLYVCNYGPAGNYVGETPYRTGSSGCENLC